MVRARRAPSQLRGVLVALSPTKADAKGLRDVLDPDWKGLSKYQLAELDADVTGRDELDARPDHAQRWDSAPARTQLDT